jgi:hypothetical protein
MKKFKTQINFIIFLISIFSVFSAFRADCSNVRWGTKTIYQSQKQVYTNPPEGYVPVFINYVGRHGARHLASINADSIMFLVLKEAETENALTSTGEKLKQMDSLLLIVEKGNVSFISERGKEEQESLGARMAQNFNRVFSAKNGCIKISTTKKERTKQSASAFLKGLNPDTAHCIVNNFNDNDELAFYDVSPAYKSFKENGNWKISFATIQNSEKAKKLEEGLLKQFFKPSFIAKLNSNAIQFHSETKNIVYNSKSFITGFYDACSIVASVEKEIKKNGHKPEELDFGSLVSCSDLEGLDYINSAEDFLLKGPGTDNAGIQVKIAAPLLLSFLNATDEYIASKKTIADLRFAHAETIAPFAALLGIKGASEPILPDRIIDYEKAWSCENIIPLSANIQWVLYENKNTGGLRVKFLLNEKEVTINGLKGSGTPFYYKWADVKDFYTRKLENMNLHTGDNIHEYLMDIQ